MARVYVNKGVHTRPENAGAQNLEGKKLPKDEDGIMKKLMPVYDEGRKNRQQYKGHWDTETLASKIYEYFEYCNTCELKPVPSSLQLWLGISADQMNVWRTRPETYGDKSEIMKEAYAIMESYLQANLDKYPTGSIFLLKASHKMNENNTLEIKSSGTSAEEVAETIKKMGLDK